MGKHHLRHVYAWAINYSGGGGGGGGVLGLQLVRLQKAFVTVYPLTAILID